MKFSMCNEFCEGWSFPEVCTLAARAGYDGVEIAPYTVAPSVHDVAPNDRAAIRAAAEERGIEIVGLHWLLARTEGLHMSHPNPAGRARTADYLRAEIDLCADLGGRVMVVGSPDQRNVLEGETYDAAWDRLVALFRALAPHATDRDVTFCIEPLGPWEANILCTAEEARRMVEAVDHPAFGMVLDVRAMSGDVEPMDAIIRKGAPHLLSLIHI